MTKHNLFEHNAACRYLGAYCHIKQSKYDDALNVLGDKTPSHLIATSSKVRRKLQHTSSNLRNGSLKVDKGTARTDRIDRSEERDRENASDIKYEAAICYLRGICYAKQNAFDRAKECLKDAVRIDVQCFEAFDQLMKNSLMSPDEEWAFLESLDFDSISSEDNNTSQEAAQFAKMLYTTRLSKYKNPTDFNNATESLSTHYNLASNPDLLLSKANLHFIQCRFKQALAITTSILDSDEYNFSVYPLHLACLHELNQTNTLFLLSHRLADLHPEEPSTWLAVGIYYLSIALTAEARRYFSKAYTMDPHFGAAWIGFAHTFAAEGEHDQAISAYSSAARLFQGTHLPQLFLGMQNLHLNNLTLAHEYLLAAHEICQTDPLLLNELGVVFYHQDLLPDAVLMFNQALTIAAEIDSEPRSWIATRANLGHAYRRQRHWSSALAEFDEVLRQGGGDTGTFCAKGLVLLEMGKSLEAVCALHEALAIGPQDPVATDLLGRALLENATRQGWELEDDSTDEFEDIVGRQSNVGRKSNEGGRGRRDNGTVRMGRVSEVGEDSMMVESDDER